MERAIARAVAFFFAAIGAKLGVMSRKGRLLHPQEALQRWPC